MELECLTCVLLLFDPPQSSLRRANNTRINDCTFEGNTAGENAGAVYLGNVQSSGSVLNSTFTNNTAGAHSLPRHLLCGDPQRESQLLPAAGRDMRCSLGRSLALPLVYDGVAAHMIADTRITTEDSRRHLTNLLTCTSSNEALPRVHSHG